MKRLLLVAILCLLIASCTAATTIHATRNPDTGQGEIYFNSPKEYGEVKAHAEFDTEGRAKVLKFEAKGVKNTAAEQQAQTVNNFVNALERAYSRTPTTP